MQKKILLITLKLLIKVTKPKGYKLKQSMSVPKRFKKKIQKKNKVTVKKIKNTVNYFTYFTPL